MLAVASELFCSSFILCTLRSRSIASDLHDLGPIILAAGDIIRLLLSMTQQRPILFEKKFYPVKKVNTITPGVGKHIFFLERQHTTGRGGSPSRPQEEGEAEQAVINQKGGCAELRRS